MGTLHVLRHTAATPALTGGTPVHIGLPAWATTRNTVLARYAQLLPVSDQQAAERLAALVAG